MSTLIYGATVVAGDTIMEPGAVLLRGGRIEALLDRWEQPGEAFPGEAIDARGCVVMPGLINGHTHGVTPGALFPSAAHSLSRDRWMGHLDRHLLAGTTTVLSLCGLGAMADVREADRHHAVHVRGATTHLPLALQAAQASDGHGLTRAARELSVERMLEDGAVAIGELGGGQTLGGGGQDLIYIPEAIAKRTGIRVSSSQARRLKEAVLGRFIQTGALDERRLSDLAGETGLAGALPLGELAALIADTVLPSMEPALGAIRDGVRTALKLGVPAIVHSASATANVMRELMDETPSKGAQLIAAHANHPSHTPQEAYELAMRGKDKGWAAEACVFDLLHRRHTVQTREHWDRLLSEPDLVSVLATDYGKDGEHDELISAVQDVFNQGHRSLAGAVAMATTEVARLIPGIAPDCSKLRAGGAADIVVASAADFRDVKFVFVDGQCVVRNGELTEEAHR
ncbi:amidohydrolase family protein [Arthrobacter crystallopoietes]|uniref:Amidohydrolase family protein n=1 Tax=Crystallibacter crystallopoietes TaxID=37928 RepID=A0A1H1CXE9_9MICC|nr:amidohydrolase family protein [Arthrobacter crystallopoietes]AUI50567.1 hypothetical protein AC20117_06720 [Arthrobacter crystallopoietes]SDQ68719.1 Amidohydrolase family protein [Arthrobacter crystallopoietes]